MSKITKTIVLKVSGKDVENTFSGLRGAVKKLSDELKSLTPGTEAFKKKAAELREAREHFNHVKNEINAVNETLNQSEGIFKKIVGKFFNFGEIFKSFNAVNLTGFITGKIGSVSDELLKISDAMSDVQKTTGMAQEEVKKLWDTFDQMDTRTSKLERLKIAEVGGRLGVPKEELASFVQEVDKAYVALGDSFQGGLESVVESLGKIKGLFEETKGKSYADAINEVGSALNELAANGTASESNISDFALRIGALPDALKPSIDKVLGLGAAFEESGVDSQIAASGYSNFMKVAGENLDKFAYSMNMSLEEARELFNSKPEEFFLRFAQGMKNIPADETAKIFDSLSLKSLEVQKAIGAAANRTDEFRDAMNLAGQSMEDATSLTDEFNKKNNNAPAILEKLKNAFTGLFTSTNVINSFEYLIKLVGWIAGVSNQAVDGIDGLRTRINFLGDVIKVVVATLLGYNVATQTMIILSGNATKQTLLSIIADKAKIAITTAKRSAILLYATAKALLSGNVTRADAAMRLFNATMKANPIGLFVGVITAAVTAISIFAKETENATNAENRLTKATQDAMQEHSKEISTLERLYKSATDASKGKDAQREAVQKLQDLYPSYFGNIDQELIMLGKAEKQYLALRDAILASARAKAAEKIIQENTEKSLRKEAEIQAKIDKSKKEREILDKNPNKKVIIDNSENLDGLALFNNNTQTTNKQIADGKKTQEKILQKQIENIRKQNETENKAYLDIIEENKKNSALYEKDKNGQKQENTDRGNRIAPSESKNRPAKDKKAEQDRKNANDVEKAKSTYNKALSAQHEAGRKMVELQRELEDEKYKIIQESEEEEKALQNIRHKREVEDIQHKNQQILLEIQKNKTEIEKLQRDAKETQSPEAKATYQNAIAEIEKSNAQKLELIKKNNEIISQTEVTHQKEINKIKEKYLLKSQDELIKAKQKEIEDKIHEKEEEIQAITTLEEAKKALANREYLELTETELKNIRTLEEAKKALREEAQRAILEKQKEAITAQMEELNKFINKHSFSEEAREKLQKDLEEFKKQLQGIKAVIQGKEEGDKAAQSDEEKKSKDAVDILGFSASQWEEMFNNLKTTEGKIQGIIMATQALSNAFRQFSKLQQALNERELRRFTQNQDKKKQALLKQLNQGLITQEQYQKGIQNIEEETAEKKRKLQERAAKAEKAANLMSAIAGTASAVVGALGMKPWTPANFVTAGIVGALGLAQVATIAATPIPEFAEGGFTGLGSGKADRTGFKPAGIVHEQEYVTPKWMLENPVVADVVDWMESIRTGRTALPQAYAEGGFTEAKNTAPIEKQIPLSSQNENLSELNHTLYQLNETLNKLQDKGLQAFIVENAENGKKMQEMISLYEKIKQKNARK